MLYIVIGHLYFQQILFSHLTLKFLIATFISRVYIQPPHCAKTWVRFKILFDLIFFLLFASFYTTMERPPRRLFIPCFLRRGIITYKIQLGYLHIICHSIEFHPSDGNSIFAVPPSGAKDPNKSMQRQSER